MLDISPSLNGYAYFVNAVRQNLKVMELYEAADRAVAECIENNILKDFFLEQRSEVVAVSIYEYNEEYARKALRKDGFQSCAGWNPFCHRCSTAGQSDGRCIQR